MKLPVKIILGVLIGGGLGFAYYFFIGCRTGSCPLTGNPFISTAYGSVIGLLLTMGSTKKQKKSDS